MHLLFAGVAQFISFFLGQKLLNIPFKIAILVAYLATIIALTAAFYLALSLAITGLQVVTPTQYFDLVSVFFPSNLHACFSVVISARILKMTLIWSIRFKHHTAQILVR